MKQEDLISIIVPIYNVEKYLNACIDSIINQTYTNIQVIVIDDGSSDNSPFIIEEYINSLRINNSIKINTHISIINISNNFFLILNNIHK